MKHANKLISWMRERQRIYRRRESGQDPPWSKDPVFQSQRFCNVFRELDKVTCWVRAEWRDPYTDHPNLPFAMAMARSINLPETLEELGFPERWNRKAFLKVMTRRREAGEKMVTSSHLVAGGSGVGGVHMRLALTFDALDKLNGEWVHPESLRETFQALTQVYGIGPFTAYEIVTDLRHTNWLGEATDIHTWCNIGQGSRRGLNRVYGRPLTVKVPEAQAMAEVQDLVQRCRRELTKEDPMFKSLEMRDIEHTLCEIDKFLRVKSGCGTSKPHDYTKP